MKYRGLCGSWMSPVSNPSRHLPANLPPDSTYKKAMNMPCIDGFAALKEVKY